MLPSAVESLRLFSVAIGRFPFLIRNPARAAFVDVTIDLMCFDSIMCLSGNSAISAFLTPLKKDTLWQAICDSGQFEKVFVMGESAG